jgi:hypothetical protein
MGFDWYQQELWKLKLVPAYINFSFMTDLLAKDSILA